MAATRHAKNPIKPRLGTNLYVAYVRVSTEEQTDLSPDAQRDLITEYAKRRGLEIVQTYEDVQSARAPGRPAFGEMMEAIRKDSKLAGVVCHKVDRLLRNFPDFALVDEYIQAGVDFQFVSGNYDNSPAGKLSLGMQVLVAKHYIDNLSEEIKKGLHRRVLVEHRWAFVPPFGYRYQGVEREAEIVPDETTFPLVKKGWDLLLSGSHSLKDISRELAEFGLRTRGSKRYPAGRPVGLSSVYRLFRNPFYYGMMRFNGELIPGTHQPMVSRKVFERCQAILQNRSQPRPVRNEFTYRGFLVCGRCGVGVTAEEHVKVYRTKGRTANYVYYHCARTKGGPRCREPYLREDRLEGQIADQLAALTLRPDESVSFKAALQESFQKEQEYRASALAGLRRRQDEIEKKRDVLTERYLDDRIADEEYERKYAAYKRELFEIKDGMNALENARELYVEELELLSKIGERLAEIYLGSGPDMKRLTVNVVASNATLKGGEVRLNLFPTFEVLAKRGGSNEWWRRRESNPRPE